MRKSKSGFTIVELLITVVVVGILAAIIIVAYQGIQNAANDTAIKADLAQLKNKMELFYVQNSKYPNTAELSTLGFRAAKNSYMTTPNTIHNLMYCASAPTYNKYGIASWSRSGNRYYIDQDRSVTNYAGVWQSDDNSVEMCPILVSGWSSGVSGSYRGYAGEDIATGPWRAWAGGN